MEKASNTTKRNRIVAIDYVLLSEATVRDYPGKLIQILTNGWNALNFSSVELLESELGNGDFVDQELTVIVSGSDSAIDQELGLLSGNEVIIRFTYSNGDKKIMGTEENPVLLSCSSTGSPVRQTLHSKRKSAEKTKYPIS